MADTPIEQLRALAALRKRRQSAAQPLASAVFGTDDLLAATEQLGASTFFHDQEPDLNGPADQPRPFGVPAGQPVNVRSVQGAIRRENVAQGVETPRLSERITANADPGTQAAVEGIENVIRGLPSGAVQGLAGGAADALKAGGLVVDPVGTLAAIAQGRTPLALQGSDVLRHGGEHVAEAVRDVTRPEGAGGMIGEQAGAFLSQGAALKGLAALREIKAAREAAVAAEGSAALNAETLPRIGQATTDAIARQRAVEAEAAYRARQAAAEQSAASRASAEAYTEAHPPTVVDVPEVRRTKPLVTPPPTERLALPPGRPQTPAIRPENGALTNLRRIMGERTAREAVGREPAPVAEPVTPEPVPARPQPAMASLSEPTPITIRPKEIRGRSVWLGGNAKYATTDDATLLARRKELVDRLGQSAEQQSEGIRYWTREDPNAGVGGMHTKRSGVVVTNAAGRAKAAINRDARLVDELDAELTGRGWNDEAVMRHGMPSTAAVDAEAAAREARRQTLGQVAAERRASEAEREALQMGEAGVPAGATDFDPSRFGGVPASTLAPIVGAGTGAATGAATDKEHPVRGAIVGGLAGLGAGIVGGGLIAKAGRRGATAVEPEIVARPTQVPQQTPQQAIDELLASVRPKASEAMRARLDASTGIRQGPARPDVDQFVNVAKFSFADPSGEQRLRQQVSRVIESKGLAPKRVVTWDEVRAMADKLGLDPDAVSRKKVAHMHGPDVLAVKNIIDDNVDALERLGHQMLDSGALTEAERGAIAAHMNALDAQNAALLDKFIAVKGQHGRDLNNLKIVAMRSNDPVAWLARAQQWAGKPLEPTTRDLIVQLARDGKVQDYLQLMGTLRKSGPLEKLGTFFKANLLTNPLTHVVNTTNNIQLAVLETAKDVPGSVFDRLLSLASGQRTLAAPGFAQAKASLQGARQGLREAKQIMKGIPLEEAIQKWDLPHDVNYGDSPAGKILNAYTRTVFRSLGAADRVFRGAALRGSLANQAKARGMDLASVLADPPDDMLIQAITDAAQATVQDRTAVGDVLRSISKAGGGVGQFIVPFSRTPGAVATRAAEYTPLGAAMAVPKVARVIKAAMKGAETPLAEQREAAKLLGRSATGSGLIALGYYLARKGLASGTIDRSARSERDTRYLTGRPPNAIRVGNHWLELGRLSPAGILVAVGANLYDVTEQGTTPAGAATNIAGTVAKAVTDQPFLTGISNVLEGAQNPQEAGGRILEDVATGFVPLSAGLGAVARGTDPTVRDASGISERIKARIPGASETLDPMLDQFGRPVAREDGLVGSMLNPLRRTTDQTSDPVLAEIDRLGVNLSRRRPGGTRDRALTRDLVEHEGPVLYNRLAQLVQSPVYQRVDDAGKAALLERLTTRTRSAASRAQTKARAR